MFCLAKRLQNPLKRFSILDYEKNNPLPNLICCLSLWTIYSDFFPTMIRNRILFYNGFTFMMHLAFHLLARQTSALYTFV